MIRVGFIPYLNMVPFHQGFGPGPLILNGHEVVFCSCSPRALGDLAAEGRIDVGALSLADYLRLSGQFEPLGDFGVGVARAAKSVLFFSKMPLSEFSGTCAVTDETSTSVRLLQTLLQKRYGQHEFAYGRVASSVVYDGSAEGLLLIGDEALQAKRQGIKGLPYVTDLGEEWFSWQGVPFVFARWAVRKTLSEEIKHELYRCVQKSLESMDMHVESASRMESAVRSLAASDIRDYWNAFTYRLSPEHKKSIALFEGLVGQYV